MNDQTTEIVAGRALCATCGTTLHGPYCHACGEHIVTPDDVRVSSFLRRTVAAIADTDSNLERTLRGLLRPGFLTAEYIRGRRRPYVAPLRIFLVMNVFFFALASIGMGTETFTTRLHNQMSQSLYGPLLTRLVEVHGEHGTPEFAVYEQKFDETTPRYANSMIILMVPMLALVLALLYGGRRYFVHHLVFALHFYALLLLLVAMIPSLTWPLVVAFPSLEHGEGDTALGIAVALVLLVGIIWHMQRAVRTAYGDGPLTGWLRGMALAFLVLPIVIIYRMLLAFAVYFALL